MECAECVLVGDIVAEEEHGGGAHGGAHGAEGLAFVGRDEQQLADLLAVTDVELPDREVDPLDLGDDGLALVMVERAVVNGDRGRFLLERELGMVGDESAKGVKELRSSFLKCRIEVEREIDVELAPVGADEVDLGREAAERSEVPQRAAGDHGDVGLGQCSESSQRHRCLAKRQWGHRVVDEGRDRAVVVTGDQQVRRGGERRDATVEFGIVEEMTGHGRRRYSDGRRRLHRFGELRSASWARPRSPTATGTKTAARAFSASDATGRSAVPA